MRLDMLPAVLPGHHGLITHTAAMSAGLDPADVNALVRSGEWVRVRRGVYARAADWSTLRHRSDRCRQLSRAASLNMWTDHVLSHESAALEHGMPVLLREPFLPHVTRPGVLGSRRRNGVVHHKAVFHDNQVVERNGFAVLDPARTAADVARYSGVRAGLVACDAALRLGASHADLRRAIEPMTCWPGVRTARHAIGLADAKADGAGESLVRLMVHELGQGRPQAQFGLTGSARTVFCDVRLGRHIFEFDGQVKYEPPERGGLADDDASGVVWQEKLRQDWIAAHRLGVSRVVWSELMPPRWDATRARLAREYAATCRLFGTDISDLAAYRVAG
ncbi:type IV toxin-antitoxin system AbiEi family antitoxin domain-containing protein [Nocardioides sp. InS609-2]|uniref:type IV toxin-antitoxin system AbiEi family antitoxin domain-containing protein n=1 Tax=Nocardioides sp. InS609-2 TaxID=2760705 RepID=UPI0020BFFC62|nr:type IV toxin-antitoxin system AbiEi family antitoxin domain-containing protein [Nocardioides sp. InS609-2]